MACTLYFLGDFALGTQAPVPQVDSPVVVCLCHKALFEAHIGEITSSRCDGGGISLAGELKDMYSLAMTLGVPAGLGVGESNLAQVERYSSDLIELSTRYHLPIG